MIKDVFCVCVVREKKIVLSSVSVKNKYFSQMGTFIETSFDIRKNLRKNKWWKQKILNSNVCRCKKLKKNQAEKPPPQRKKTYRW